MSLIYGVNGLREYDEVSSSSTSNSYEIDINSDAEVSCINTEMGFINETGGVRAVILNGSTTLSCNWRLWTNSTTSTYAAINQTNFACNYWMLGNANNSTYGTMENFRIQVWIYNRLSTSEPYAHPWVVGTVNYEGNNGYINEARFTVKSRSTSKITGMRFYNTASNNINWYIGRSWSVMDD